jgi:hypothetical protein
VCDTEKAAQPIWIAEYASITQAGVLPQDPGMLKDMFNMDETGIELSHDVTS